MLPGTARHDAHVYVGNRFKKDIGPKVPIASPATAWCLNPADGPGSPQVGLAAQDGGGDVRERLILRKGTRPEQVFRDVDAAFALRGHHRSASVTKPVQTR